MLSRLKQQQKPPTDAKAEAPSTETKEDDPKPSRSKTATTSSSTNTSRAEFGKVVSKSRLAQIAEQGQSSTSTTSSSGGGNNNKNNKPAAGDFNTVAANVLKAVQAKKRADTIQADHGRKKPATTASSKLQNIFRVGSNNPASKQPTSDADRLVSAVMAIDQVYSGQKRGKTSINNDDDYDDDDYDDDDVYSTPAGETLPLIGSGMAAATAEVAAASSTTGGGGGGGKQYGSTKVPAVIAGAATTAAHRKKKKTKKSKRFFYKCRQCCHMSFVMLFRSCSITIGIPALILAIIVFYQLENGLLELDFLPGNATLCWWLIFTARQCVMLDAARIIQWIMVDYIALSSKIAVQLFGPLLTLVAIQSHGWPYLATCWSLLDLSLLYGDNKFQRNWFFSLRQAIFLQSELGGDAILMSDIYLRILLSMLVAGLLTSIKRTSLAMYFGRKTVVHYRSRLEKLLADISAVVEVAQLADEANKMDDWDRDGATAKLNPLIIRESLYDTKWHTMTGFGAKPSSSSGRSNEYVYDESEEVEGMTGVGASGGGGDGSSAGDPGDPVGLVEGQAAVTLDPALPATEVAVRDLLDSWDEPVNKHDKMDVSINDILQFQKALTYMDEQFPFSVEFGPATSRDECVKSSQDVYRRLLKLSDRPGILSFEVLKLLSLDENGVEDEGKTKRLQQIFRPDKSAELPLLAFVQSCDSVYKGLRFFRASVRNSSVIDKVLQDIIDAFYYFALSLLILSMMNFDPWPLLASVSTLLISFSFAFGNSTARIVDGILLIAAQRPYDLGDRIVINGAEDVVNYGVDYSWYVEDINLFTTTLRFAKTNEVATVSNGTIIQSRIVNCQRSQNALVTLHLQFRVDVSDDDLEEFVAALEDFVRDRPRLWDSLVYFQCESISSDDGVIKYILRARHTKTWQDAPQILASKAELLKFCSETGKEMEISK